MKEINPIAYFHSPFTSKFGIPRQSGLVETLHGHIVFEKEYRNKEAVRGIEEFDYLWLIWGFSENEYNQFNPTVRPPRLGGNERIGVFASRSPFRPNGLGLSSVRISSVDYDASDAPVINVIGADLMDGTPIYDIKPYVRYADCHNDARSGFADKRSWNVLEVDFPERFRLMFAKEDAECIAETLSLDPRPHYHDDPERIYGMSFAGRDVRFRIEGGTLIVVDIV